MLEDHKKLLYPNCEADKKKLGTTLELVQWKAENGVSDKGFGNLLIMLKKMLPKDNEFPESVRTPILSHTDLACNTSYHFAASRTVSPRVPPYLARDHLRLSAHVYDSVASIHMTKNPGRHD